jgi:hypothetical protein
MFRNVLKILLGFFLVFVSQPSKCQTNKQVTEIQSSNYCEGIEGTWQIQMTATRKKPAIPISVCKKIREERLKNEAHYIRVNQNMRIMVLSKKTINSPHFTPIAKIKYLTADEIGN